MMVVDVPAAAPLRRPTAAARRALCWAQIVLGALVVLAACAVAGAVQDRVDARGVSMVDTSAALVEAVLPSPIGETAAAHGGVTGTVPDHSVPDHSVPDHSAPDHSVPDHSVPDHSAPDHSAPDHSAPDHSAPGSYTFGDGALAAIGTLIVGFTLTASAGTIGRRRLDDREAARWDADWARVEPVWSGRVR